jgi:hypothetical protein
MFSFSSHMGMTVLCDAQERKKRVSERMTWYVKGLHQRIGIDHSFLRPADREHYHVLGFEPHGNTHILCNV